MTQRHSPAAVSEGTESMPPPAVKSFKKPAASSPAPTPTYRLSKPVAGSLYVGDASEMMSRLSRAGMAGKVDLFFADPPFNIGHDYGEGFIDNISEASYKVFTRDYVFNAIRLIRPGGAMFLHLPDHEVADAYAFARDMGMEPINWLILHQEFGQYGESRFITSKVHCLYFVKPGGPRTWNVEEILEPGQRLNTGDARTETAKYKGLRPMLDVWHGANLGRVQGNNKERWGKKTRPVAWQKKLSYAAQAYTHPNQVPEMYLARIIRCASNPGDLVFDAFFGSGTSWAVAAATGRRFMGTELTDYVAESGFARVQRGVVRDVNGPLVNGPCKVE